MGKASLVFGRIYTVGGKVPVTDSRCCCGDFPGNAYYCLQFWAKEEDWYLVAKCCRAIPSQESWDLYQFGVEQTNIAGCTGGPWGTAMWVTDEVKHATQEDCEAACA